MSGWTSNRFFFADTKLFPYGNMMLKTARRKDRVFPYGKKVSSCENKALEYSRTGIYSVSMNAAEVGKIIQMRRKELGLTQVEAAQGCHVGTRFLSDLENGKETAELGKTLEVLHGLGLRLTIKEV